MRQLNYNETFKTYLQGTCLPNKNGFIVVINKSAVEQKGKEKDKYYKTSFVSVKRTVLICIFYPGTLYLIESAEMPPKR